MKTYIGIDQSVGGFGMIFLTPEAETYRAAFSSFPLSKYGKEVHQLRALEDFIIDSLRGFYDHEIRGIAREGFAYESKQGREKAGAIAYAVDSTLAEWLPAPACYPAVIPPRQLKEFVTAKGNASKEEMCDGVEAVWGVKFTNDNLADAYGLARIAYSLDTDYTDNAVQQRVLDKIRTPKEKSQKKVAKTAA